MLDIKKRLLKSAIKGKNRSIRKIVQNTLNISYSVSLFFLENDKLAKNNIKNIMTNVYENISNLNSYKDFHIYFYSLIKEGINNFRRKDFYKKNDNKDDFIDLYFKYNNIKYEESLYIIFKEILNFEDEEKEIFILIEFEGLSCKNVSELLNIPLDIVRYKLYNSKKNLMKFL